MACPDTDIAALNRILVFVYLIISLAESASVMREPDAQRFAPAASNPSYRSELHVSDVAQNTDFVIFDVKLVRLFRISTLMLYAGIALTPYRPRLPPPSTPVSVHTEIFQKHPQIPASYSRFWRFSPTPSSLHADVPRRGCPPALS